MIVTWIEYIKAFDNEESDTNTSMKEKGVKQIKQNWENKPLHRKYPVGSQNCDVDKGNTHLWQCSTGLKAEMEDVVMAAQKQSLFTKPKL